MITVVTAFTANFEEYGKKFVDTFFEYWPEEVNIICYVEKPIDLESGSLRYIQSIPGYSDFMDRNDNPRGNGRLQNSRWFPKDIEQGYSYRFNARKFAVQGFVPYHAAQGLEGHLIWMDADVITYRSVTMDFLYKLFDSDSPSIPELAKGHLLLAEVQPLGDLTYLGRFMTHSEIGFVGYRLPECLPGLKQFSDYYDSDSIFDLDEWHSAYVFDQSMVGLSKNNLTPKGKGHVWFDSPLALYFDHCKGKRKDAGFSKERFKWADKLQQKFSEYLC